VDGRVRLVACHDDDNDDVDGDTLFFDALDGDHDVVDVKEAIDGFVLAGLPNREAVCRTALCLRTFVVAEVLP